MNQQLKLQEKEQNDIVLTITEDYISIQKEFDEYGLQPLKLI